MTELERYRSQLPIQPHKLDEELEIHAMLQERISTNKAVAHTKMLEAKDLLDRKESRLLEDLKTDEVKGSIPVLQGMVQRDPDRLKAWDHYQACRAEYEAWEGLYESWKSRGFNIKVLAELWVANYYTGDYYQAKGGDKERVARQHEERRAEMRRAHGEKSRSVAAESNVNSRRQRAMIDPDELQSAPKRRRVVE